MKAYVGLVCALLAFIAVATANSGGYRFGVSDQAFYVPAVALAADPALFPRDRLLLLPQMRVWLGDDILALASRATGGNLPVVFGALYVATLTALCASAAGLSRALRMNAWVTGAALVLLTLRHRIAKTGANSLEGYMHPRMLAFAIGIAALASLAQGRYRRAAITGVLAALVHPTTGAWFVAVYVLALLWDTWRWRAAGGVVALGAASAFALAVGPVSSRFVQMDAAWLAALAEKDYLFSLQWPVYAWITNLGYPLVLLLSLHRRRQRGLASRHEEALVAGLLGLVVVFLLSLPATHSHVALVVQLQVNRVFWILDAMATVYISWWLASEMSGASKPGLRGMLVATLTAAAISRGVYVLTVETKRPLFEWTLPANEWTETLTWIRAQNPRWLVLADPGHAWKYGTSVRVGAMRDVVLEAGKDTAFAMYDRAVALRVVDRTAALADFDTLTTDRARALAGMYGADVLVERSDHPFDFPVLHRNDTFVVYDVR